MKKFIAQPYYSNGIVRIYKTANANAAAPDYVLNVAADGGTGVNSVLVHKRRLFVAVAEGVFVYDFDDIFPTRNNTPPQKIILKDPNSVDMAEPNGVTAKNVIGLAINPDTDDLYCTLYGGGSKWNTGVYLVTANSNYINSSQFLNYLDHRVARICANLAFKDGHLWLSSFDEGGHFLTCFKNVNKNNYILIANKLNKDYTAKNLDGSSKSVHIFSGPEGIAFDRFGNMWLANNNDDVPLRKNDFGDGTLVKIKKSEIDRITTLVNGSEITLNPDVDPNVKVVDIFNINGGKLGGITFDDEIIYINDQGTNQGSDYTTNGQVWNWDVNTDFNGSNLKPIGVHTCYPGNGGASLSNFADVYVEDTSYSGGGIDTGIEPDAAVQNLWESNAILITNSSTGSSNVFVKGNSDCFIRITVKNRGPFPSSGTEKLKLYWAKASSSLGWPDPWNNNDRLGGEIESGQIIPPISANGQTVLTFPFHTPDPQSYLDFPGDNHHFCLLVRILDSEKSLSEQVGSNNALINNVRNNNNIAWRNIAIDNGEVRREVRSMKLKPKHTIVATNYHVTNLVSKISFEISDESGRPIAEQHGRIKLSFADKMFKLLNVSKPAMENLITIPPLHSEGLSKMSSVHEKKTAIETNLISFHLKDIKIGLSDLMLKPGIPFGFSVEFEPLKLLKGYTLRVTQFAMEKGVTYLIGGQTFICGNVNNLPKDKTIEVVA